MNEKLRQINLSLREQARGGITYAPGLVYAPPRPSTSSQGGDCNCRMFNSLTADASGTYYV